MSRTVHRAGAWTHPERPERAPIVFMAPRAPQGWQQQPEWDWFRNRVDEAGLVLGQECRNGDKEPSFAVAPWVPILFETPVGRSSDERVVQFFWWMRDHDEYPAAIGTLLQLATDDAAHNRRTWLRLMRDAFAAFEAENPDASAST